MTTNLDVINRNVAHWLADLLGGGTNADDVSRKLVDVELNKPPFIALLCKSAYLIY